MEPLKILIFLQRKYFAATRIIWSALVLHYGFEVYCATLIAIPFCVLNAIICTKLVFLTMWFYLTKKILISEQCWFKKLTPLFLSIHLVVNAHAIFMHVDTQGSHAIFMHADTEDSSAISMYMIQRVPMSSPCVWVQRVPVPSLCMWTETVSIPYVCV